MSCPRRGRMGRSSPTLFPITGAQAPAAFTTTGAWNGPRVVSTPETRPWFRMIPVTSVSSRISAPSLRAAPAKPRLSSMGFTSPSCGLKAAPTRCSARPRCIREASARSMISTCNPVFLWRSTKPSMTFNSSAVSIRIMPPFRWYSMSWSSSSRRPLKSSALARASSRCIPGFLD